MLNRRFQRKAIPQKTRLNVCLYVQLYWKQFRKRTGKNKILILSGGMIKFPSDDWTMWSGDFYK